jgi:hypothetical protein
MSKIGFLVIAFTALALMVLSVVRERRSERWRSQGLCHQCGAHLGVGSKSVPPHFMSPGEKVRICGGCVKERRIQRWMLASFALIGLIAAAIWWWLQHN